MKQKHSSLEKKGSKTGEKTNNDIAIDDNATTLNAIIFVKENNKSWKQLPPSMGVGAKGGKGGAEQMETEVVFRGGHKGWS